MNPKVKTALFAVTFIPYFIALLNGLRGAISGTKFFYTEVDGFIGFLLAAGSSLVHMIFFIPVIPVGIVFHLLCLLRKIVPFINNISEKEFTLVCAVICFAVFITIPVFALIKFR